MKQLSNMLLATLVAAALMQLYRAHMELKYNCEALAWQVNSDAAQLKASIATSYQRTHRDAQKIAELEAKIKALTAAKTRSTDSGSVPAALF